MVLKLRELFRCTLPQTSASEEKTGNIFQPILDFTENGK